VEPEDNEPSSPTNIETTDRRLDPNDPYLSTEPSTNRRFLESTPHSTNTNAPEPNFNIKEFKAYEPIKLHEKTPPVKPRKNDGKPPINIVPLI